MVCTVFFYIQKSTDIAEMCNYISGLSNSSGFINHRQLRHMLTFPWKADVICGVNAHVHYLATVFEIPGVTGLLCNRQI